MSVCVCVWEVGTTMIGTGGCSRRLCMYIVLYMLEERPGDVGEKESGFVDAWVWVFASSFPQENQYKYCTVT